MGRKAVTSEGRVVETRGRRVVVAHEGGETVCFLTGLRAVAGDRVRFEDVPGSGGKLVEVLPRRNALVRADLKGRSQVIAANLGGVLIVMSATHPAFRPGLLDRYWVAAESAGIPATVALHKCDLGVPEDVEQEVALREAVGVTVLRTSTADASSIEALRDFLGRQEGGPWAFVGHSGVGKTSLVASLCPDIDVGDVGDVSEYWGTGQHTTTRSRIFAVPGGGEVVDSPGIRTFAPAQLDPEEVRLFFPGVHGIPCKYRDCRHRLGEAGCVIEATLAPPLVTSYRRLLDEIERIDEASRP